MSKPSLGVGLLLKETLHEIGVEVAGPASSRASQPPLDSYALGNVEGLSVQEQLRRMLGFSNNYITDVFTMDMPASIDDHPLSGRPPSLGTGVAAGDGLARKPQWSGEGRLQPGEQMDELPRKVSHRRTWT